MDKILTDDDIQTCSDRLENARTVVVFLGKASQAICEREEPMTATGLFGMCLVYRWVADDLQAVQQFILEGTPLSS